VGKRAVSTAVHSTKKTLFQPVFENGGQSGRHFRFSRRRRDSIGNCSRICVTENIAAVFLVLIKLGNSYFVRTCEF